MILIKNENYPFKQFAICILCHCTENCNCLVLMQKKRQLQKNCTNREIPVFKSGNQTIRFSVGLSSSKEFQCKLKLKLVELGLLLGHHISTCQNSNQYIVFFYLNSTKLYKIAKNRKRKYLQDIREGE